MVAAGYLQLGFVSMGVFIAVLRLDHIVHIIQPVDIFAFSGYRNLVSPLLYPGRYQKLICFSQ